MKLLREIYDKDILGVDEVSKSVPRYTSRCILKRCDGLYGVMYAEKFNLYSLVGGGIDEGETKIEALKREVFEETGCRCDTICELGYVYENRAHIDFTQFSYYYIVTTNDITTENHLEPSEIASGTRVMWLTLDEVVHNIITPVHDTTQRKFIQAKDTAALNEYLKRVRKL